MKTLDVGCGDRKTEGAVGIDIVALPGVDIVHDLDVYPWPLDDGSFDKVLMLNIIEHLDDTIKAMREVHRILKPGGIAHIETVYWNHKYTWSDPQHKHAFTELSWEFFTGKRKEYYTDFKYELVSFVWQYDYHLKHLPKFLKRFLGIFFCNVIAGMVVELRKPL
jgi:SAM-dependent methyltransferase